jgi:glycosyltransferase involved in cell wall biosynthesis
MEVIVDGLIYENEYRGGISRVFSEILPRMCDLDVNLRILMLVFGNPSIRPPHHQQIIQGGYWGAKFLCCYKGRGQRCLIKIRKLLTRLEIPETRHKIWHSTYYSSLPFWRGLKVVTVYDFIYEEYSSMFSDANIVIADKRREITQADAIICISHATKKDLLRYYNIPEEKVYVIYPAYNSLFSGEKISNGGDNPFFLYVGSRAGYKGFGDLLGALGGVHSDIELVVVGQPFSPQERQAIEAAKLQGRITLRTNISDEELRDLYHQAVAFTYPSLAEGFGIPLLEAMACGCPIVASRIPSTIEVAKDIPYYFEPGSPESLRSALGKALLEGGKSARRLAGFDRVKDFSWDKAAQETLDVYRSLL